MSKPSKQHPKGVLASFLSASCNACISPDGKWAAAIIKHEGQIPEYKYLVTVWETETGVVSDITESAVCVMFSHDCRQLILGQYDGVVKTFALSIPGHLI